MINKVKEKNEGEWLLCLCVCFVRKYRTLCIKYYYHYYALLKIFINTSRKGSAMKLFWSLVQIMSTCVCIKFVLGNKNKNENKKKRDKRCILPHKRLRLSHY